ncbi:MAG TPA: hypothetical protein VFW78_12605 [Bacteroidia bacterium]|nr:hypothetical protein [Bacteroidia bacterium]
MNPTLRNILAVVIGVFAGGALNMGIIMISGSIIPPPEGADLTTMEGLKASMHLMEPKHFLMPFLAHALGTLLGAWVAVRISATHKMRLALILGGWFMIGGITNVVMLPSPMWFTVVDLVAAYLPMAWIGGKLATGPVTQPA